MLSTGTFANMNEDKKNSLMIPKGSTLIVNRRGTDNTICPKKRDK